MKTQIDLGGQPITIQAKDASGLLVAFKRLNDQERDALYTPGHMFCLEDGQRKILYLALDPRMEPPKDGVLQQWIKASCPPEEAGQYLVRVCVDFKYGPKETHYEVDLAWYDEVWYKDGSHGYQWTSILNDWDEGGGCEITHWMKLPEV